jgi:hypothetical protein
VNPLTRYVPIIEAIAALALVAAICFGVHQFLEHERDIGRAEVQARWDAQKTADEKAAALQKQGWADQQIGAANHATDRQQINQAAAAAAGAVAGSLRDAIAAFAKARPDDTASSARASAATLGTLLADCEGRYREMAEIADGHASDVRTLKEAWPKNGKENATP